MSPNPQEPFHSAESARVVARAALAPRESGHLRNNRIWERFIAVLRPLLPVVTIVLAVYLVLGPLLSEQEVSFNLSRDEVEPSDGKVRMVGLAYVGSDDQNRLFRVEADNGLQDDPGTPRISLDGIRAEMELEPEVRATVTAQSGIYRTEENSLSLIGGVELVTGNGYSLQMAGAEVDLKTKVAVGQGRVRGRSPMGTLEAGRVELNVTDERGVFTGGVKMRITPVRPTNPQSSDGDAE